MSASNCLPEKQEKTPKEKLRRCIHRSKDGMCTVTNSQNVPCIELIDACNKTEA
jgi:hypothetical protein